MRNRFDTFLRHLTLGMAIVSAVLTLLFLHPKSGASVLNVITMAINTATFSILAWQTWRNL